MNRNEARETLMQILYELDASKAIRDGEAVERGRSIIGDRMRGNHIARCTALFETIMETLDQIDEEINAHSTKWKTSRMPKVDLAIMRLAVGEMKYSEDVPHAVAINEAINLAKKYSTDHSAKFVHGVLRTISKIYTGDRHE